MKQGSSNKYVIRVLATVFAIIGGIVLVIFGLMAVFSNSLLGYFTFTVPVLTIQNLRVGGALTAILGVISIIAAACTSKRGCSAVLFFVCVATGGLGGSLVFLGAFLGLISRNSAKSVANNSSKSLL